ncbi:MAG TPA: transcriptional regulator GcvA [Magnetospirillaceae bacterium]|jgi:LysR family glycine cleavage system transcriptional activator
MVRRLPPLNAMRAFEAAARLGSFVRAADELAVTPTAISHQIKGLEDTLGVELFIRLPRGLRLSTAGAAYLPELTKGFDALARAGERLAGDQLSGLLHINTLASFAHCWLVPRIINFQRRYPELNVRVSTAVRHIDFIEEDVDVAIRYGKGVYPGLRSIKIMEEEVCPVAAPSLVNGNPPLKEWTDLQYHPLIHDYAADDAEPWVSWPVWLRRAGLDDRIDALRGLAFDNSASLVEAAVRGHGVALGRSALVAEHVREGRLVPLFDTAHPADYAYFAVTPEATADHPRVKVFVEWLKEEAASDIGCLRTAAAA